MKGYSLKGWIVCLSCALFFFYEFIQMLMTNSLAPYLMQEFKVTGEHLGLLSSAYFDANVIFLLPAGIILDRFSTKRVVIITMLLCIAGTLGFAVSQSLISAAIFRFITGIGSAFCFLSCMRLATIWFAGKTLALVTGIYVAMAFLGGLVAQTPLTLLINHLGWRNAILVDAALGLFILFLILINVKDYPNQMTELRFKTKVALREMGFLRSIRLSYSNLQNWLGGICTSLINLPVYIIGGIWGILFFHQTHGFSSTQASTIVSMILFGTMLGSPIAGWISDTIRLRKPPLVIGTVISLLLITLIIYGPNVSMLSYCILLFMLGLVSSVQIINYPLVSEKNPTILAATSISVVSLCTTGGGALFQPIVGALLDKSWSNVLVNGIPSYSINDYHHAFILLPIGFIIALVALIFIKESYAKPQDLT